jgi:hypothetical protein
MAWKLEIWWGYSDTCSVPSLREEFDVKADGLARAEEILSDGHAVISPGNHHFYPASGITHVCLVDIGEEE